MMTGVSRSVYFGAVFAFDFLTILLCSGIIATLIALCNPTESIATEVEIGGKLRLKLPVFISYT